MATDPLAAGWTALRAFFSEGAAARDRALEAFQAAEQSVRASGDSSRLTLWLLGMATALRYTRRPEPMEAGLARARELVNLITREMSEDATVPYRTYVETAYRDLADVVPTQAEALLNDGIAYSDRTLRLARASSRDEWLGAAQASRGDLLQRQGRDRRALRRALVAHEEARRRWPSRDTEGRAQAGIGYGKTLLALGEAAKAERAARESLGVFVRAGDRYHEAAARLLLARALFALDQSDALDEQASALVLYRALGCVWEARKAEGALG